MFAAVEEPVFRRATVADVPGLHLPVIGVLLAASVILLAQGIVDCVHPECHHTVIWAIVCGAGSVVASLVGLFYAKPIVIPTLSFLLLAWWTAGAGVLTFDSPYTLTYDSGNGYVAAWLGFIAASVMVSQVWGKRIRARPVLIGVIIASAVELVSAIVDCNKMADCTDYRAFAVAAGGVGVVLGVIGLFMSPRRGTDMRLVSLSLFLWWAVSWVILTFKGPFNSHGNGFFAAWAAAILVSALLVNSAVMVTPDVYTGA